MRHLRLLLGCLLCCACSIAPESDFQPTMEAPREDPLPSIRKVAAAGRHSEALELLEPLRWETHQEIRFERLRQDLRISRGQRLQVLLEIAGWLEAWPEHPDLLYLQARLLEDPVARYDRFHTLLRSHPQHDWIRHAAIVTAQQVGNWNQSATWLSTLSRNHALDPPADQAPSARRLRLLQARQYRHDLEFDQAFRLLATDAFGHLDPIALQEYLNTASLTGDQERIRRAEQEFLLQGASILPLPGGEAIDLAFERLLAEWPWCGDKDLAKVLHTFDGYLERAGAPFGWHQQPLYDLMGVAKLVMPETASGEVSRAFAASGRALLAGSAWGRGNEIHLLGGTRHLQILWPGHAEPVEMILASEVRSSAGKTAQGGSVFRGFYMLLDSVERSSRRQAKRLDGYLEDGSIRIGSLPPDWREANTLESLDLGLRLRLRALADSGLSVEQLETLHLALHEAGHFGEVLRWIDFGLPVAGLLPRMLSSRQKYGDPLLWLEYRAQLRAMACDPVAGWSFAEILERGQDPSDPYYAPYRQILIDLVQLSKAEGWPKLSQWHQKTEAELAGLAQRLCDEQEIGQEPQDGVDAILAALVEANILDHAPSNRSTTDQIDQR